MFRVNTEAKVEMTCRDLNCIGTDEFNGNQWEKSKSNKKNLLRSPLRDNTKRFRRQRGNATSRTVISMSNVSLIGAQISSISDCIECTDVQCRWGHIVYINRNAGKTKSSKRVQSDSGLLRKESRFTYSSLNNTIKRVKLTD